MDAKNPTTHQHTDAVKNQIESRLVSIINRIESFLISLESQPDESLEVQPVAAKFSTLLAELQEIQALQQKL